MKIKVDAGCYEPVREHETDAGIDLLTPVSAYIVPNGNVLIDTGIHIQLPHNTVGMLKSKSGLNVYNNIVSEGVIDEGYTGSIKVKLYNHGNKSETINKGDKITQLVVLPVMYEDIEIAEDIAGGERGDNGFGSTGK